MLAASLGRRPCSRPEIGEAFLEMDLVEVKGELRDGAPSLDVMHARSAYCLQLKTCGKP